MFSKIEHDNNHWIKFDTNKLKELRETYTLAMEFIEDGLPAINLNSRNEIIHFFEKTFQIQLKSSKIKEIAENLNKYHNNSPEFEIILGIVYFFKMKYTIKNYIDCALNHEVDGVVKLREYFGSVTMPNRQPLPYSAEVLECVISYSDGLNLKKENKYASSKLTR